MICETCNETLADEGIVAIHGVAGHKLGLTYEEFVASKQITLADAGLTKIPELNSQLFPFQRDIVAWALRKGRAAIFADCGLGKTPMQLEWARHVPGPVLILAPLAVAQQTVREGKKFGIDVRYERSFSQAFDQTISNYEMLEHFDPSVYAGVVLDESSILKSYDGAFRNLIIEKFSKTPFRLAATATPAPNDYMELGNHSEFLGALTRTEMLSTFFVHDGGDTSKWRVKRHAQGDFWKWVCSWAVMMRKPSDLGYDDDGFVLPPLVIEDIVLDVEKPTEGYLFALPANTLQERRQARSVTVEERAAKVAAIVATKPKEPWLIWCNLNSESTAAKKLIPGCVEVTGSDSKEFKEAAALWFVGQICDCQLARIGTGNQSANIGVQQPTSETPDGANYTPQMPTCETKRDERLKSGKLKTQKQDSRSASNHTESLPPYIKKCSSDKRTDVRSAELSLSEGHTSTIATPVASLEDCSAAVVTSDSDISRMTRSVSAAPRCTCGGIKPNRKMVSKGSIFGFGLNFQHCWNVVFLGLSDSWEGYYQMVRRCWRFGQKKQVNCYIVTSSQEGAVTENIKRKEKDAAKMAEEMVNNMHELNQQEVRGVSTHDRKIVTHKTETGDRWTMHLGDCVEVTAKMPSDSVHYSIFSPPFASLYTYSALPNDMGNCRTHAEFYEHFAYLTKELHRVMMPGRCLSFHCMNLPVSKERDGYIGIADFRGDLIRMFQEAGFIYHSEVCIWKDPVTAMQRTKALGLLHKQIKKDSCMSRQGIADYLVTMRKHGDNPERVGHTNESFPVAIWQRYASPVWMDIDPSDTLQRQSAREEEDERHICPLQLEVIRRGVELWSNPGDVVFSPFAGIGSEGYIAIQKGRRFLGVELKESYFRQAVSNLKIAHRETNPLFADPDVFEGVDETA
jgi:hypothetical protein